MIADRIKELEATRRKLAALETEVAVEQNKELAALPARYGFTSADTFIAAVRAATTKRRGRKPATKTAAAAPVGRRRRAKITDETRAEVKKLVQAGKTGSEIAKSLKISLPSVQNIKKALGLVKRR